MGFAKRRGIRKPRSVNSAHRTPRVRRLSESVLAFCSISMAGLTLTQMPVISISPHVDRHVKHSISCICTKMPPAANQARVHLGFEIAYRLMEQAAEYARIGAKFDPLI